MLNSTFSVYYATKFESWIWSSLNEQKEAHSWQDPNWKDRVEGEPCSPNAQPENMDANPYRKYCKDHGLPLGTIIEPVSNRKYNIAVLITAATESLKYVASTIEALARCPLSLCFSIVSLTGESLRLNREQSINKRSIFK